MSLSLINRRLRFPVLWLSLLLLPGLAFSASAPLFWRVKSLVNPDREVYLLGSIHYGDESLYPLPENVMEAFDKSDVLAVELDIAKADRAELGALLEKYGRITDGEDLRQQLGEKDWGLLESICRDLSLSAPGFLMTKPWLVAVQLVSVQIRNSDYSETLGVDRHFLKLARGWKQVQALESLEQQIAMFGKFSRDEQVAFLRRTLANYSQGEDYQHRMAEAWRGANQSQLEQMVLEVFSGEPNGERQYELLFTERNLHMAAAIEDMLRGPHSVFVVVGVGHMLGDRGLVAELQRRGYRVESVSAREVSDQNREDSLKNREDSIKNREDSDQAAVPR